MTLLLDPPASTPSDADVSDSAQTEPAPDSDHPFRPTSPMTRHRWLVMVWIVAIMAGLGFVVYGFGPVFSARDQRRLMRLERADISRSANEASGLGGVSIPTMAPQLGVPVAILEIGRIRLQQVVVEGAYPSQTRMGPGHVAGTAGPGQPGNSVIVGRARAFGGPFRSIGRLTKGDPILVTTSQGQSVYRVTTVTHPNIRGPAASATGSVVRSSTGSIEALYGPSRVDQLTLVTSASALPWNDSDATVVVATLQGVPFAPTPQNGRGETGLGIDSDQGADAAVVLSMILFGLTMSASIVLYRRVRTATAYLLTIGPVMAAVIVAGETFSRLLPAWT